MYKDKAITGEAGEIGRKMILINKINPCIITFTKEVIMKICPTCKIEKKWKEFVANSKSCRSCNKKTCSICHNIFQLKGKETYCSAKCNLLGSIEKNENDCWIWQKCTTKGYGNITHKGKWYAAHRLSYLIFRGEIPEGMHVCHKCDEPLCINPDHLWAATNKENHLDKISKGRSFDIRPVRAKSKQMRRGENHGQAKLRDEDVKIIKSMLKNRSPISHVCEKFKASYGCIYAIKQGLTWKHVE